MTPSVDRAAQDELAERIACVSLHWRPESRLHPGDLCWAASLGDGNTPPTDRLRWGTPLTAFADVRAYGWIAEVSAHVSPAASPEEHRDVAREVASLARSVFVSAARSETRWWAALRAEGFTEAGGPWFARLHRDLADPADLEQHRLPDGFRVRPAGETAGDLRARAALHRRCWAPARIAAMLGNDADGEETESAYTDQTHDRVRATPLYRAELDLVVEGPGGLCAYALGWLDPDSASMVVEPVGTDPAHAGRGLARAVSAAMLTRAAGLGATQAVIGARGDDGYPVPRRVYAALGLVEVAQSVLLTRREPD